MPSQLFHNNFRASHARPQAQPSNNYYEDQDNTPINHMKHFPYNTRNRYLMTLWLKSSCVLLICMIMLGGLTRLTNSGLSIVEWNPVTGIIPAITASDWDMEFSKYKSSPEYLKLNSNITIEEFKSLYYLEFVHRLFGRVLSLFYLLPFIYFYCTGCIKKHKSMHFAILTLFAMQGVIGWYMVKSGLVDHPYVSHFRLAIHLIIACIIYSLLLWQAMSNSYNQTNVIKNTSPKLKLLCIIFLFVLYIQILLGALTAGLDAGLIYNYFPLMGTKFIPDEIAISNFGMNSFSDPVFVQFMHRICAYTLTLIVCICAICLFLTKNSRLRKFAYYVIFIILLQFSTGVITLIYAVPIFVALLHQLGAVILLSYCLRLLFLLTNNKN